MDHKNMSEKIEIIKEANEVDGFKIKTDSNLTHRLSVKSIYQELGSLAESLENSKELSTTTLSELQQSFERESVLRENAERELEDSKRDLEDRVEKVCQMQTKIARCQLNIAELEAELEAEKGEHHKSKSELENSKSQIRKLQSQLDDHLKDVEKLSQENKNKLVNFKNLEETLKQVKKENLHMSKHKSSLQQKLLMVEEELREIKKEDEVVISKLNRSQKELEVLQKDLDLNRKHLDELVRERDSLKKKLVKVTSATKEQEAFLKVAEHNEHVKGQEIERHQIETNRLRKMIVELEKDRNKHVAEKGAQNLKIQNLTDEVKVKESLISQQEKKFGDTQKKLKEEEKLQDVLQRDRDLYVRQLMETKEELAEMKQRAKLSAQEVELLREGMKTQEQLMTEGQQELQLKREENGRLQNQLQQQRQQVLNLKNQLEVKDLEIQKLNKVLADETERKTLLEKQLGKVMKELNQLTNQQKKSKQENATIAERVKALEAEASNDEKKYQQKVEEIHQLNLELERMRKAEEATASKLEYVDELRKELFQTNRELVKSQTKSKMLEDELQTPLNVHRWRMLEGADPPKYDLIQKILILQQHLVKKSCDVANRELELEEKQLLNDKLQQHLTLHTRPDAAQELQQCQYELREKTKQMKSMASEVNMYESFIAAYQHEIQRISTELMELQKKYLAQKKQLQKSKETVRLLENQMAYASTPETKASSLQVRPATTGTRIRRKIIN